MRILVAGVLGGIAMFIWASVAHVATPLARMGLKAVPNEAAVSAAMHRNLGDKPGLYFIPFAADADQKTIAQQEAKLKVEPSALLAYQPPGANQFGRQLGVEFTLEVIESILTAALLVIAAGFAQRLAMAVMVGVVAALATNFSYWNWYGFSFDYTLANAFTELMKFVVAGVVIALALGWRRRASRRRT